MYISPEILQAIQHHVAIEEVIAAFISLKKKGPNLWACCPFHHENTPSFCVSPHKGFYKCFGCDAAGDAITFIREMEGLNFVDAVVYLAQKYGIVLPTAPSDLATQEQHDKDSLYSLLHRAQAYYAQLLWQHPEGQRGVSYLEERGITRSCSEQFGLGYCLSAGADFCQFAEKKGYSTARLAQAGLLVDKAGKTYDRFRGRLLFPIHTLVGQVIGFGARQLTKASGQPKYLNSPETAIYHKSDVLYGLYQAKKSIKQAANCYLVEGYTDVLALHQAGIAHVVATAGTALTDQHLLLLSRFTTHLTLLFDGDAAGVQAALRGIDKILAKGMQVHVVLLPEGEDPDSYVRQFGAAALQAYLQTHAQDFITFKASFLQKGQADAMHRVNLIKDLVKSIAVIPDALQRAVLTQQCSQLVKIPEAVLLAEQQAWRTQAQARPLVQSRVPEKRAMTLVTAHAPVDVPISSLEAYERESIRLLLLYGKILLETDKPLYVYLLQELSDVTFSTPAYQLILAHFQEQLAQGRVVDAAYFINHPEELLKKTAIDITASPYALSEQWQKRYHIVITPEEEQLHAVAFKNIVRLKMRLIQQLLAENRTALQQGPAPAEEERLLKIHITLKQAEATLAQQLGTVVVC